MKSAENKLKNTDSMKEKISSYTKRTDPIVLAALSEKSRQWREEQEAKKKKEGFAEYNKRTTPIVLAALNEKSRQWREEKET